MAKMYIYLCEDCGREFQTKNKRQRFCSLTCFGSNRKKKWAIKFDRCQQCGTVTIPHYSYGLCTKCYNKSRKGKCIDCGRPRDHRATRCKSCATRKRMLGKKLSQKHRDALSRSHWSKKPGFVHPTKGKGKKNFCVDCDKQIRLRATRCIPCATKESARVYWANPEKSAVRRKQMSKQAKQLWAEHPEWRERQRQITLGHHAAGIYPKARTKIELTVMSMLQEAQLSFLYQHKLAEFICVDFFLPTHKLVIECFGTYWHCDPRVYPNGPQTKAQRKNSGTDRWREKKIAEMGYQLLILWEKDIKEDPTQILSVIKDTIRD